VHWKGPIVKQLIEKKTGKTRNGNYLYIQVAHLDSGSLALE